MNALFEQHKYVNNILFLSFGLYFNVQIDIQSLHMGSFLFREKLMGRFPIQQIRRPPQPQAPVQAGISRRQRSRQAEVYNPAPIFRQISLNKITAIEKSPVLYELIHDEHWQIYPALVEHLRIFNVFDCIQASNAHALTVELYHTVASRCTSKLHQESHQNENWQNLHKFKEQRLIIQEYSQIYASLFNIQFLKLRKLIIKGNKNNNQKETIVSLQVLQYLDSPCLEQLHADGHNLTSVKFLKKCHWKRLTTLSLRQTKIADSSHFASILPCISNSKHIQALNFQSKISVDWYEFSWLLKMGFACAEQEKIRLDSDDEYYFANNQKVLRRVEFGTLGKANFRSKHLSMIAKKFNNSYFDNPLVLW